VVGEGGAQRRRQREHEDGVADEVVVREPRPADALDALGGLVAQHALRGGGRGEGQQSQRREGREADTRAGQTSEGGRPARSAGGGAAGSPVLGGRAGRTALADEDTEVGREAEERGSRRGP